MRRRLSLVAGLGEARQCGGEVRRRPWPASGRQVSGVRVVVGPGKPGLEGRPGALFRVDPAQNPGIGPFRAVGIRAVLFWFLGIQTRGRPENRDALERLTASLLVSRVGTACGSSWGSPWPPGAFQGCLGGGGGG